MLAVHLHISTTKGKTGSGHITVCKGHGMGLSLLRDTEEHWHDTTGRKPFPSAPQTWPQCMAPHLSSLPCTLPAQWHCSNVPHSLTTFKETIFSLQNALPSSHSALQHTLPSSAQKSTSQESISLSRCHPFRPVPKSDQKPHFFPTSHRCHYQPVICEWFLKCRPFPASLRTGRGQFLLSFAILPISRPVP